MIPPPIIAAVNPDRHDHHHRAAYSGGETVETRRRLKWCLRRLVSAIPHSVDLDNFVLRIAVGMSMGVVVEAVLRLLAGKPEPRRLELA